MGRSFQTTCVSSFCVRDAFLSRDTKSLVPASAQGDSGIDTAAKRMRRLFGPMSDTARQGLLEATDSWGYARIPSEDDDFANSAARCKAEEDLTRKERVGGRGGKSV